MLRIGGITHGVEIAQHGLLARAKPLHEPGIIKSGLSLGRIHPLQDSQAAIDQLLSILWHLLPFRHENISNVNALLRRQFFQQSFAVPNRISLGRRKPVPILEIVANLRLPLGRQALKLLVVAHEPFLLFRRHVLQIFHPFRRECGHPP